MKNPFVNNDNRNTWIIAVTAGVITAGVGAWLYFTKKSESADNVEDEHAADYLQVRIPKKRKHKTDIHELEDIAAHQHN